MNPNTFNILFYVVILGLPAALIVWRHRVAISGVRSQDLPSSGFALAMGIVALVVGGASLFSGMIPLIGIFGAMFGILGALLAFIGLFAGIGTRSIGVPAAGLIVCVIPILWQTVFVVGFTGFESRKEVSMDVRAQVEAQLAKDPRFPARPVWWENGHLLGVGVIKSGQDYRDDAAAACAQMRLADIRPAEVQVFDILKIQNDDDWVMLAQLACD